MKNSQSLFTEYVEHFFGSEGELWIVFKDAGVSLRNYIYEPLKTGHFIFYQHSWLWTKIRISLKKWAGFAITSSEDDPKSSQSSERPDGISLGHQLIGTILRQVSCALEICY